MVGRTPCSHYERRCASSVCTYCGHDCILGAQLECRRAVLPLFPREASLVTQAPETRSPYSALAVYDGDHLELPTYLSPAQRPG
jgi:hypothetical protein